MKERRVITLSAFPKVDGRRVILPEEIMKEKNLDWEVELGLVMTPHAEIPGYHAVIRKDTKEALGIVKSKYVPIQNAEAFSFVGEQLNKSFKIADANEYFGGKYVSMTLDKGTILDGKLRKRFDVINSHDGSTNLVLIPYFHSVQGNFDLNFLHMLDEDTLKHRHTESAPDLKVVGREYVKRIKEQLCEAEECLGEFSKVYVDDDEIKALVYSHLGLQKAQVKPWERALAITDGCNNVDEAITAFRKSESVRILPRWVNESYSMWKTIENFPGMEVFEGTLMQVYAGLSYYYDHVKPIKNEEKEPDTRWESLTRGSAAKAKTRIFDLCNGFLTKPLTKARSMR